MFDLRSMETIMDCEGPVTLCKDWAFHSTASTNMCLS